MWGVGVGVCGCVGVGVCGCVAYGCICVQFCGHFLCTQALSTP